MCSFNHKGGDIMYCPKCGGTLFSQLPANDDCEEICEKICVYCNHGLFCRNKKSGCVDPKSFLIKDKKLAAALRVKHNASASNLRSGKKNVMRYREFRVKAEKEIEEQKKQIAQLMKESPKQYDHLVHTF